jgi:hypothetical protein
MEPEWLKVLLLWSACMVVAVVRPYARIRRAVVRGVRRTAALLPRRHRPLPARPIELIARDARRLGHRFREPPRGVSFAKFEGTRWAYDKVLAEGCRALEIEHLLDVLPPGPELDAERARVEVRLWLAGFRIDEVA